MDENYTTEIEEVEENEEFCKEETGNSGPSGILIAGTLAVGAAIGVVGTKIGKKVVGKVKKIRDSKRKAKLTKADAIVAVEEPEETEETED